MKEVTFLQWFSAHCLSPPSCLWNTHPHNNCRETSKQGYCRS
uniref:Uncharacterized protein n=1 Tax=Anguilla anguilla TaxID=7936 RepID=A0A0E9U5L8_ANGAN